MSMRGSSTEETLRKINILKYLQYFIEVGPLLTSAHIPAGEFEISPQSRERRSASRLADTWSLRKSLYVAPSDSSLHASELRALNLSSQTNSALPHRQAPTRANRTSIKIATLARPR